MLFSKEKIVDLTSELLKEINHRACSKITFPDIVVPLCVSICAIQGLCRLLRVKSKHY